MWKIQTPHQAAQNLVTPLTTFSKKKHNKDQLILDYNNDTQVER